MTPPPTGDTDTATVRLHRALTGRAVTALITKPQLFMIAAGGRNCGQRTGIHHGTGIGHRHDEGM